MNDIKVKNWLGLSVNLLFLIGVIFLTTTDYSKICKDEVDYDPYTKVDESYFLRLIICHETLIDTNKFAYMGFDVESDYLQNVKEKYISVIFLIFKIAIIITLIASFISYLPKIPVLRSTLFSKREIKVHKILQMIGEGIILILAIALIYSMRLV